MVFWETDFVDLCDFIDNLIENYTNETFIIDVLKEIKRIRRIVPVNPGIVAMCANNIIQKQDNYDFKKIKYLIITTKNEQYYDYILEKDNLIYSGEFPIEKSEIREILYIKKDTLETYWPTLVHKVIEK